MNHIKYILLFLTQYFFCGLCFAQTPHVATAILPLKQDSAHFKSFIFNRVLRDDGKIFGHVTGIVQDQQGTMWFTTKKGLFRYDGYRMSSYKNDPLDPNSIATDALEAIWADASGIIWIGTLGKGLERFDPATGVFTHFRHNEKDTASLSYDWISSVLQDREGNIWIGSGRGLDRLDPHTGRFIHYRHQLTDPTSISSNIVVSIYEDRQGTLWIGTGSVYGPDNNDPSEGGLNRMDKKTGKFTRYLHDPKDPHSLINNKVKAIFESRDGTFWVGTAGDGLHTMDRAKGTFIRHPYDPDHPEKLSRPALNKEFAYDHITFITEDITGGIWIGTAESGFNYYDPKTARTTHYEREKDVPGEFSDRTAWWAYSSREGVLWLSTLYGQLYRIDPLQKNIPYYPLAEGNVNCFYEDTNGRLWVGTQKEGVTLHDSDNNFIRRYINDPQNSRSLITNGVQTIYEDKKGNLWLGTLGKGMELFNKGQKEFIHYRHDPKNNKSLSNDVVLNIYEDRKNELWVGTVKGLNRMNRKTGSFTRYIFYPEDTASFGSNIVTSVLEDKNNQLWVSSWMSGGVHLLNRLNGKFTTYLKEVSVIKIYEDKKGILWAAGYDGLFYYKPETDGFVRFTDPYLLKEITDVRSLIEDDQQNLWLSTQNEIIKINRQRNEIAVYGKNYGVNNMMIHSSSYKGRNGKLYFADISGYYAFFPDELSKSIQVPEIIITSFRLENKPVQPDKNGPLKESLSTVSQIRLQYDQNIFSFDFAAIDYSHPGDNHHLFMLENYDHTWNQPGADRRALYFNVPPGTYIFRVKAVNGYGVWAEKNIEITIIPPWWSTWWFRITALACVVGLIYGLVRWRVQEKFRLQLERSEKEKQLADLRHKTADLEMQALRAQMNPHFIFNSLNSINRFILQNNKDQASEYLTKFSRLVRLILQNSQYALIPLESEIEALQLYLELEAVRFDHHFEYKVTIENDLDISALKVAPLIIQPYTENAIWHGLMHKEEKGHLEIEIYQRGDFLYCKITDDGIGRRKAAELKSKSASTHKSMGMRITADRIAIQQIKKQMDSSIKITDLILADGTPGGTEVLLKIPVQYD